jgi:hypothetical protein
MILVQLLAHANVATRFAGPDALTTSGIFALNATGADAICLFYLDHQSIAPIRFAVRRLRKKFPQLPIAVCLWGAPELSAKGEAARADATIGSLKEAIDFCLSPPRPPGVIAAASDAPSIRLVAG